MPMYYIQGDYGGPIKFGLVLTIARLIRRISECQVGSPVRLHLVGLDLAADAATDKAVRNTFKRDRQHGDWFHNTQRVVDHCSQFRDAIDSPGMTLKTPIPRCQSLVIVDQPATPYRGRYLRQKKDECFACAWKADRTFYRPRKLNAAAYDAGFGATLRHIPKDKRERARLDGASLWDGHYSHPEFGRAYIEAFDRFSVSIP